MRGQVPDEVADQNGWIKTKRKSRDERVFQVKQVNQACIKTQNAFSAFNFDSSSSDEEGPCFTIEQRPLQGAWSKPLPKVEPEADVKSARKVTFKGDNENLMTPPCEVKVFRSEDPPSAISSDEEEKYPADEEYFNLKRSSNAWKPRREPLLTAHEQQTIFDKIRELKQEIEEYEGDNWADMCEVQDLERQIDVLEAKLGY